MRGNIKMTEFERKPEFECDDDLSPEEIQDIENTFKKLEQTPSPDELVKRKLAVGALRNKVLNQSKQLNIDHNYVDHISSLVEKIQAPKEISRWQKFLNWLQKLM